MHTHIRRTAGVLLAVQMLLAGCTATAHAPQPGQPPWPEPQQPNTRVRPDFHAPSATHCARPVTTHEVGWNGPMQTRGEGDAHGRPDWPPSRARESRGAAESPAETRSLEDRAAASGRLAAPAFAPQAPPPAANVTQQAESRWQRQQSPVVTAGVIDDNADFSAYLAFRSRHRVEHRPRDVRDRYLLEVKDAAGRGVADAEVAVQSASGAAMWARTDAGGRAWLHPDAFDPARATRYEVAVRKDGRESRAQLVRGQRSAVEVRLDGRAAQPRARLDLVFLIDATGSMADEIHKLKTTLRTIVSEVSSLPSRPDLCLGLVAYRDRGDAFLLRSHDFTSDVGAYLSEALMPLQAGGGGDYPEAMNEALHETVHRLSWRGSGTTRMVVLLADAPPHLDYGAPHYDDDMLAALGKGIKIFGVGASGLDRQGEYIQRQIAQYTGGKFVFLTYANRHEPSSGPGRETVHDVKNYSVDTLDRLVVRLVTDELAKLAVN